MTSDSCEEAAGGGPIVRARTLRKNAPDAEQLLWYALKLLKPLGLHFRRQTPVGSYFPDSFVTARSSLLNSTDRSMRMATPCNTMRGAPRI